MSKWKKGRERERKSRKIQSKLSQVVQHLNFSLSSLLAMCIGASECVACKSLHITGSINIVLSDYQTFIDQVYESLLACQTPEHTHTQTPTFSHVSRNEMSNVENASERVFVRACIVSCRSLQINFTLRHSQIARKWQKSSQIGKRQK